MLCSPCFQDEIEHGERDQNARTQRETVLAREEQRERDVLVAGERDWRVQRDTDRKMMLEV